MAEIISADPEQGIYKFRGNNGGVYEFYDKDIHGLDAVSECESPVRIPFDIKLAVNTLEYEERATQLNIVLTRINDTQLYPFVDEQGSCGIPMANAIPPSQNGGRGV